MHELTTYQGGAAELAPVIGRPADQNPAVAYLAGLREGPGRRTMRQALNLIAGLTSGGRCDLSTFPWAGLRFQHTAAIRAKLAEGYAPATANKMLAALRGTLKAAWRLGQVSADDYQRAADLGQVKGETLLRGRALTAGELRALFAACARDTTPAGARDAALLAILYGAGLRRSEAVALAVADYDPESGAVTVRAGKGHKARVTYVGGGACDALAAWLTLRGQAPGALFWPVVKGGGMIPRAMSVQAVYKVMAKRAAEAGVREFSPHDLRRSYISDLLDAGADLSTAQRLAGHASTSTTTRYDRRGEAAKRKAAGLLHVPYLPAGRA